MKGLPQMNAEERRYKHAELTEEIIGVFYEVYNELGIGFLEKVYEEAMALVLRSKGIAVQTQVSVPVWFRGTIFFFKQKTAYEIGLGIPAEPLFRSHESGQ